MDNSNNNHHRISYSSGDSSASSLTTTAAAASAADPSSTATTAASRDQFLRHLNKLSHKISKPTISSAPFIRRPMPEPPQHHRPPPPMPPLQQQPPVYNISKSDFRDVVQKLTGSPAHDRPQAPAPPIQAPKPASSRLQRIRPPPLAQLTNRPPPLLNVAGGFMRPPPPGAPLSPLPPLPSCHAAAESPISAYMRFLHSSASDQKFGNPMFPPPAPPQMQTNPTNPLSESLLPPPPSSPLPAFGCLLSPKSPCPLLSPNLLFSPTTGAGLLGFPQLPVSPTVPGGVPSPK